MIRIRASAPSAPKPIPETVATNTDRKLAIIAGASAVVSIAALLARWADVLPAGLPR
jgi:hypothetical protein